MRVLATVAISGLFALAACGDNKDKKTQGPYDGGEQPEFDAGTTPPASSLDRPGLPRPPSPGLPSELRPPR